MLHWDFYSTSILDEVLNSRKTYGRIKDWINAEAKIAVLPSTPGNDVVLIDHDGNFVDALVYEVGLFLNASLRSTRAAKVKNKHPIDFSPWGFISMYYAAYYAANALLRATGVSFTYLEGSVISNLNRTIRKNGITDLQLPTGYYRIQYDKPRINVRLLPTDSGNGSHHALWSLFKDHIEEVYSKSTYSTSDHQETIAEIDKISDGILGDGTILGLSSIRNNINYRLPDDVWIEKKRKTEHFRKIHECMVEEKKYNQSKSDLVRLISNCLGIVEILTDIQKAVKRRGNENSFLNKWFERPP